MISGRDEDAGVPDELGRCAATGRHHGKVHGECLEHWKPARLGGERGGHEDVCGGEQAPHLRGREGAEQSHVGAGCPARHALGVLRHQRFELAPAGGARAPGTLVGTAQLPHHRHDGPQAAFGQQGRSRGQHVLTLLRCDPPHDEDERPITCIEALAPPCDLVSFGRGDGGAARKRPQVHAVAHGEGPLREPRFRRDDGVANVVAHGGDRVGAKETPREPRVIVHPDRVQQCDERGPPGEQPCGQQVRELMGHLDRLHPGAPQRLDPAQKVPGMVAPSGPPGPSQRYEAAEHRVEPVGTATTSMPSAVVAVASAHATVTDAPRRRSAWAVFQTTASSEE